MFASGTRPPSGVNESCQPLIGAAARVGGRRGEERGVRDAEADFLAFHVAARTTVAVTRLIGAGRGQQRIAARFGPVRRR